MKLSETVKNILEHPIATTMIVSSVVNGVVRVIAAAKGCEVKPNTVITIGGGKTKPTEE